MTGRYFLPEEKLEIIQALIQGVSPSHLAANYQIHVETLREWRKKYEKYGAEGLKKRKKHRTYTRAVKESRTIS